MIAGNAFSWVIGAAAAACSKYWMRLWSKLIKQCNTVKFVIDIQSRRSWDLSAELVGTFKHFMFSSVGLTQYFQQNLEKKLSYRRETTRQNTSSSVTLSHDIRFVFDHFWWTPHFLISNLSCEINPIILAFMNLCSIIKLHVFICVLCAPRVHVVGGEPLKLQAHTE